LISPIVSFWAFLMLRPISLRASAGPSAVVYVVADVDAGGGLVACCCA